MKTKILVVNLVLAALLFSGCGTLIPKKVEFFQKKVQEVPDKSTSQVELEKQVAYAVTLSARVTSDAALSNNCPTNVTEPAKITEVLASAVSTSVGPPKTVPSLATATNLATALVEKTGSLDSKVAAYREKIAPLVGKKIEGTGFIKIPYFLYIGLVALAVFIAWSVWKIYASSNPVLSLGTNAVGRVASAEVAAGYAELVKGGELFKEELAKSGLADAAKSEVAKLFTTSQKIAQSGTTKNTVEALTVKPSQA